MYRQFSISPNKLTGATMSNWVQGKITEINWWTDKLFTIRVKAKLQPFKAGQFTKLALIVGDKRIARAYSFVNSPNDPFYEFYCIEVENGQLTSALASLHVGNEIWLDEEPSGFFTLDEIPNAEQLWMLSTGTAIGPFLSMLQDGDMWNRFSHVILVHGVRYAIDLTYQTLIESIQANQAGFSYVPVVSREMCIKGLEGRITKVLDEGTLEHFVGSSFHPNKSQFMICGNPQMVKDTTALLESLGFSRNRRASPGHITVEQYW
ncbi:Ferredoxin--NADP(+) reductase [Pseudoalteromonas luteoviolacea B = ATCC 29581]|nr:Ferredoxin--NADP(+) reductase [Pseudoalteromonas luteoviolacea B = ATCC 29581]